MYTHQGRPRWSQPVPPAAPVSCQVITLVGDDQGKVTTTKTRLTGPRVYERIYDGSSFQDRKELQIRFIAHQGRIEVLMAYPRGLSLPYKLQVVDGRFYLVARNDQGCWAPIREIQNGEVPREIAGYFQMRCADRQIRRTCRI